VSRTTGVSHISSRCPGLVKDHFNFAVSLLAIAAAGGAAGRRGRCKLPARVGCVLASGLFTRAGDGAVRGPSRGRSAAALGDGAKPAAVSDAPWRILGMGSGSPIMRPIWLKGDCTRRLSGPSG
jgi:hypothetical protein